MSDPKCDYVCASEFEAPALRRQTKTCCNWVHQRSEKTVMCFCYDASQEDGSHARAIFRILPGLPQWMAPPSSEDK
eukprot:9194024-Karenia_brevis.AAC.1